MTNQMKHNFTLSFYFTSGFLIPYNRINEEIKKFCCQENLECNIFKSGNLLEKRFDIIIKGFGTDDYANDLKLSIENFMHQF